MGLVKVETKINAPPELCFDLARSTELHIASAKHTSEKIVGGVSSGLLKLGDVARYLHNFLKIRGAEIKRVAENGEWRSYL